MYKKRGPLKFIIDRLCFPILIFLGYDASKKLGLTPIDEERTYACLKHSIGKTLDMGCAENHFIKAYNNGYGIDKYFANNPRFIQADAARVPFKDKTFDTITFIASLNHIVDRAAALKEAVRILKDDGQVLITMINPVIGYLAHNVIRKRCDPDQMKRHLDKRELLGISAAEIEELVSGPGLKVVSKKSILLHGNTLYICEKSGLGLNALQRGGRVIP